MLSDGFHGNLLLSFPKTQQGWLPRLPQLLGQGSSSRQSPVSFPPHLPHSWLWAPRSRRIEAHRVSCHTCPLFCTLGPMLPPPPATRRQFCLPTLEVTEAQRAPKFESFHLGQGREGKYCLHKVKVSDSLFPGLPPKARAVIHSSHPFLSPEHLLGTWPWARPQGGRPRPRGSPSIGKKDSEQNSE